MATNNQLRLNPMKSMIRVLTLGAALLGMLAVAGCKTVSISSNQFIGGPLYAPSNPATVQILREPPTRPNVRLGEVTAEPSSDQVSVLEIETKMQQAAAKMGADAVVIVSDRNQVTGAYVTGGWYNRTVQTTTSRVVVGVAIKYVSQ